MTVINLINQTITFVTTSTMRLLSKAFKNPNTITVLEDHVSLEITMCLTMRLNSELNEINQ